MNDSGVDFVRFCRVWSKTLELGPDRLCMEASREAYPEWDSLRHLELMMALEQEFGLRFSSTELVAIEGPSALWERVCRHLTQVR
jgi:acyl carrier protein